MTGALPMFPPPTAYGLPAHFASWRTDQMDAIDWVLAQDARFAAVCAPTGFGKTLLYMALAKMSGMRTVVLTSTKGLQDQLQGDFGSVSKDIRGKANYLCPIAQSTFGLSPHTSVADAPCQFGYKCPLKAKGCRYYDLYRECQLAGIVVTNYQNWFYDKLRGVDNGLDGELAVDLLVLDECHDALDQLAKYLGVELTRKECLHLGVEWPSPGAGMEYWQPWAGEAYKVLKARSKSGAVNVEVQQKCQTMMRKLARLVSADLEWVVEDLEVSGGSMMAARFDPLSVKRYAESVMFRGVGKVMLVSATASPRTAESLGIPLAAYSSTRTTFPVRTRTTDARTLAYREYPSSFPVTSRPVIHVPTVQMNFRNEKDDGLMEWLIARLDQVIGLRGDRKGIVHTVSYRRARLIMDNSRYRHRMLMHGTDNRGAVIFQFRNSPPESGAILLSPSVDTGYDFPGDDSRYQVIVKLPFPVTRNKVTKARVKLDKGYSDFVTAQVLQQMTGRIVRSKEDWGETIILDDNVRWFVGRNRRLLNRWWLEAYREHGVGVLEPLKVANGK
jgi:Rad3-related DNA helicase